MTTIEYTDFYKGGFSMHDKIYFRDMYHLSDFHQGNSAGRYNIPKINGCVLKED